MLKVLVASNYYFPSKNGGGPVKSLLNLVNNLEKKLDLFVLTLSKDVNANEIYHNIHVNKWKDIENHKVKYIDKFTLSTALKELILNNYSSIYLNSFFASSSYIFYAYIPFFKKINFIIAPRGEFNTSALRIKKIRKKMFITFFKTTIFKTNIVFHATSEQEKEDILRIFPRANIVVISNIPSINSPFKKNNIKKDGNLNIVTVSRISKMKNIDFALKLLSNVNHGEISFDIYGPIEDKEYYQICTEIIKKMPENIKVTFKGSIENEQVNSLLKNYDLFFSPTLGENYGHSIVEAIQTHVPVLISDNTPWIDLEKKKVGKEISLDRPDLFVGYIEELIGLDNEQYADKFTGFNDFIYRELKVKENIEKYYKLLGGETVE